jgi:hypothetical protein
MSPPSARFSDWSLVQACLRNDRQVWQQLFDKQFSRLAAYLHTEMRQSGASAVEGAHDVFVSLCMDGGQRLRRFDPRRGGLGAFLRLLAREHVRRLRQRLRRRREVLVPQEALDGRCAAAEFPTVALHEFLDRLAEGDRDFCQTYCLGEGDTSLARSPAPDKVRKHKQRLGEKLSKFFGEGLNCLFFGKKARYHVTKRCWRVPS